MIILDECSMSSLVESGKLSFRRINPLVSEEQLTEIRGLSVGILDENPRIVGQLDELYCSIHVGFFQRSSDSQILNWKKGILKDPRITQIRRGPAASNSRNRRGVITVRVKDLEEQAFEPKRRGLISPEDKYRMIMLEEFCHLVEHEGDTHRKHP